MKDEPRPLRQLGSVEKILVKLRRCPTCHKRLTSVPYDQTAGWNDIPASVGKGLNGATAASFGRSRVGHVTQLRDGKTPHCPGCGHTFVHGWIYPAAE
jgi:hypothetical protein